MLLLAVVRPSLEYGNENVIRGRQMHWSLFYRGVLKGCSSRTCNKAVRGDMGLDTLERRREVKKGV